MWTKLEIVVSRIDHFFGDGLSSLSFWFPPNVKVYVLDLSVLHASIVISVEIEDIRTSLYLSELFLRRIAYSSTLALRST